MNRLLFLLLGLLLAASGLRAQMGMNEAERALILSGEKEAPMRVFLITQPDDSLLLRQSSYPVTPDPKDTVLAHFIQRLYETVTDSASMGVGIAAPQVGLLRRIVWVQRFDKENFPFEVYLNPVIRQYSQMKRCGPEGCLSIPERRDSVFRAYAILLEYDTPAGQHLIEMVEGFTAVIFQHEIDHLNGMLYIDHLPQEIGEASKKEPIAKKPLQTKPLEKESNAADSPASKNKPR